MFASLLFLPRNPSAPSRCNELIRTLSIGMTSSRSERGRLAGNAGAGSRAGPCAPAVEGERRGGRHRFPDVVTGRKGIPGGGGERDELMIVSIFRGSCRLEIASFERLTRLRCAGGYIWGARICNSGSLVGAGCPETNPPNNIFKLDILVPRKEMYFSLREMTSIGKVDC